MKKPAIIILVLALISGSVASGSDSTQSAWEYLKQGPYTIGYTEMSGEIPDSIQLVKERFRKVTVAVWYPDVKKSRGLTKKTLPKEFPVILLSPMIDAKLDAYIYTVRYLASHGFVVATFPSSGDEYTGGHPVYRSEFRQLQLESLKILLQRTTNLAFASSDKVGLIGHSYGGPAAINLALLEKNIDAVVSLDGTEVCKDFADEMAGQFPYYDPAKLTVPYMLMLADLSYCIGDRRDLAFYDGVAGKNAYLLQFYKLTHLHFAYSVVASPKPEAKTSFEIACLYMLNFFKAYLHDDTRAQEWLQKSPKDLNLPTDLFEVGRKSEK